GSGQSALPVQYESAACRKGSGPKPFRTRISPVLVLPPREFAGDWTIPGNCSMQASPPCDHRPTTPTRSLSIGTSILKVLSCRARSSSRERAAYKSLTEEIPLVASPDDT